MPKAIAIIIESAVYVCALWALAFLSVLLHEAGHALGYRIATGDRHWRIRVGSGKKLLDTGRLTVKLLPFDGCFIPSEENKMDTAAKRIAMLAGGPAVSLIITAVLLTAKAGGISPRSEVIASDAIGAFVSSALFFNLFILILALIPARYFFGEVKGMETDGLQMIHALRDRGKKP